MCARSGSPDESGVPYGALKTRSDAVELGAGALVDRRGDGSSPPNVRVYFEALEHHVCLGPDFHSTLGAPLPVALKPVLSMADKARTFSATAHFPFATAR